MKPVKIKIGSVKNNPSNPRIIKDYKFDKLVKSIIEFPEMLKLRPIVVDENNVILGGNMRYKAAVKAGLTEIYAIQADELSDKQKKEFIIKDNSNFGEWDWDLLANEWDTAELKEWGLDVWQPEESVDYSILDEIDLDNEIENMYQQTKKSVILEYPTEQYEAEIKPVYDKLKASGIDIPAIFLKALKNYDS